MNPALESSGFPEYTPPALDEPKIILANERPSFGGGVHEVVEEEEG